MKYKVGDKVRIRKDLIVGKTYGRDIFEWGMCPFRGNIATIENTYNVSEYVLEGLDYWWTDEMIECLVEPSHTNWKIVIRPVGDTILASLYEGDSKVKEAVAKRHPADKYDANIGASLAFNRLMDREVKPESYNAKVVCIDNGGDETLYTVGKIYEIKNGLFHPDNSNFTIKVKGFKDFENGTSKWLEIVE